MSLMKRYLEDLVTEEIEKSGVEQNARLWYTCLHDAMNAIAFVTDPDCSFEFCEDKAREAVRKALKNER